MFTGIIDHCGVITQVESIANGLRIWIKHRFDGELTLGESIAVDGFCLTVIEFHDDVFACDISPETLQVTTASRLKIGQQVNLERALQPSSRLGGHFVMGHVDQTAFVKKILKQQDFVEMQFAGLDKEARKFVVKKGSIAVHGVSLTINDVTEEGFSVMLIPHTLSRTNLEKLQENDTVNLEFDLLARLVVKQIENIKHE